MHLRSQAAALLCLPTAFAGHELTGSAQVALLAAVLAVSLWPVVRDQRSLTAMVEGSATSG